LAVLRRLVNIKNAHQRGAGKVGLAGQFNMSAKVLTSVDAVKATPRLMEKPPGQGQQRTVEESMCKCKARPCADKVQIPEMRVHAKLVSLARLLRDWERMLDAVRDSWELGDGNSPTQDPCPGEQHQAEVGCRAHVWPRGFVDGV